MAEFGGVTYEAALDRERLGRQARLVWDFMVRPVAYNYFTLREISDATGQPEPSVSSRLRDFRKAEWGSHVLDPRRRGGKGGTWEYRLIPRVQRPPEQIELRFDAAQEGAEAR